MASKSSILLLFCTLVDVFRQGARKKQMSFLSLHLRPFHRLSMSLLKVKRGRTRGCGSRNVCVCVRVCVCVFIYILNTALYDAYLHGK